MRRFPEHVQVFLSVAEKRAVKSLSERTRVPQSVIVREALIEYMRRAERGEIELGVPGWRATPTEGGEG